MSEIKGQLFGGITISMAADKFTEAFRGVLMEHATSTTEDMGNLRFRVSDPDSGRSVILDTSVRIPINKSLIEKLENLEVDFTVYRA